jgi:hypothetical protein
MDEQKQPQVITTIDRMLGPYELKNAPIKFDTLQS